MKVLALMMQQAQGGQIEQIARTFGVDWPHLIAQVISFSIVCALLYWLAYQPVLKMLETRRQQIAQGQANAEKITAALAEIEADRKDVIAAAHAAAARLIEDARGVAKRVREQETQRAVTAAEQIVLKARTAADQEHARMMVELRHEVGHLVLKTTAAVAGRVLTADDQRRLAEETARQLS